MHMALAAATGHWICVTLTQFLRTGTLRVRLCTVAFRSDGGECACRIAGKVLDMRCPKPGWIPDCNAIRSSFGQQDSPMKVSVQCRDPVQ